jgi:hypothetical protein
MTPVRLWHCVACGSENDEIDGECQFCECQGVDCKRDNCSSPAHSYKEEPAIDNVAYCKYGELGHFGNPDAGWYWISGDGVNDPSIYGPFKTEGEAYAERSGRMNAPRTELAIEEIPF